MRAVCNDNVSVIRVIGAFVLEQPEEPQVVGRGEVSRFMRIADLVLAEIELSEIGQCAKVLERGNVVDREGQHLHVRTMRSENGNVIEGVAPEIEFLDVVQRATFGLLFQQPLGEIHHD